jgi:hypothetical protein
MTSKSNLEKVLDSITQCQRCYNYQSSQCIDKLRRKAIQNLESQVDADGELILIKDGVQKCNESTQRKDIKRIRKNCNGYKGRE